MNAIKVEDLTVVYDVNPVLWDVDVSFKKGKRTAIVGPNGAGKSTLVKTVMELIKPISGTITFEGNTSLKQIAYVPQSGSVDWDFPATVLDVVLMGRYGHVGWFKKLQPKDYEIAHAVIKKVGMEEFEDRHISELSGGQQQRTFLARALAQESDIYILDEPLKGVDVKTEQVLMDLLKEISDNGKTVIAVHHDLSTVPKYFEEVVLINKQVIASGSIETTYNQTNIDKAYKGVVL